MIWRHGPRKLAERLHVTTSPARSQAVPSAPGVGRRCHCTLQRHCCTAAALAAQPVAVRPHNHDYSPQHRTGPAARLRAARAPTTIAVRGGAATQVAWAAVAEDATGSGQEPQPAGG
jgi:xanthine dehydrogenase iron-sulfur cluster and FAD-binding subunit A